MMAMIRRVKGINPKHYSDIFIGLQQYKKGQYKASLSHFKKIINQNGGNAYVNFRCGMCHYKLGDWGKALEYFKKAKNSDGYDLSWDEQYHTAQKKLKAEIDSSTKLVNVAEAKSKFEKNKKDLKAIEEYADSLVLNKSYWLAKHTITDYFDSPEAVRSLKLLLTLVEVYEKLTNYDLMKPLVEEILQHPNLSDVARDKALYMYGICLLKLGEIELSRSVFNKIIEKSDNKELIKYGVGYLHEKNNNWCEAEEAYQNALLQNKYQLDFYLRLALVCSKLYKWSDAASHYELYIDSTTIVESHIYFKCGEAFEKNGDYNKSAFYYEEAILRSSDYRDYWYYRYGYVLSLSGRHDEADNIYRESRKNTLPYGVDPSKVLKNNTQGFLASYTQYYETLPIRDNFILLESFLGRSFSCNPYALLLHMLENEEFLSYRFVISMTDFSKVPDDILNDKRVIVIKRGSDAYLRYLASCKYLINNVTFPYYFIRKEDQIYLNTWHGTPIKTLGKDIASPLFDYANVARNFLQCTHIISQNRYTNDILLNKYDVRDMYTGFIAETGYPRVDLTVNINENLKRKTIELLQADPSKPIVVYAPTWRGTSEHKEFDKKRLIKDLKHLKSDKYNLVLKAHHYVEEFIKNIGLDDVLISPEKIDTNILLGCTDILISDYSSIIFDFLPLNKPIISYVYDFGNYELTRGLYFNEDELLGDICFTVKQVKRSILKSLDESVDFSTEQKLYTSLEDGSATKRVIDFIFKNDQEYTYSYERKPVDLLFSGPYIPNGISRSFDNLLKNLDITENLDSNNYTVIVNASDIKSRSDCNKHFIDNKMEKIAYQARIGSALMTIEELAVRENFEKHYQLYSEDFKKVYLNIYAREARRLFGDTKFCNVVNFEGYALFWVSLFSVIKANKRIIYQHNDIYREWKTRFPYLEGVSKLYSLYDEIISVSQLTMLNNKKNLSEIFNIESNKFKYANNTILVDDIIKKSMLHDNLDDKFIKYPGGKLLSIGRLSHEKDHEKLIRAFKESNLADKNVRLYIIGSGPLESHLNNLINELELQDSVYLLGQKENPYPYLAQCDLFVLPSNHEGQPMVLLEALTLGKPILATDIVGNRGVLQDKYGVLVENSIEGLVNGLMSYYSNEYVEQEVFDAKKYNREALDQFLSYIHN